MRIIVISQDTFRSVTTKAILMGCVAHFGRDISEAISGNS
jgi:hypothetical protein